MRLKHQNARQATHPVDVSETGWGGGWHLRFRESITKSQYYSGVRLILSGKRELLMFGIFVSILLIVVLLSTCGEIMMRVRLTKREPSRDKLAWWRRGGDEVAATYEQLFPHSPVPILRRFVFWLVLASAVVLFVTMMLRPK